MYVLGSQLSNAQYEAVRQSMAQTLPALRVQIVNCGGKFAVNGRLTADELAAVSAIYNEQSNVAPTGYDIMAHQRIERGRRQTHNARAKRQANALRFGR